MYLPDLSQAVVWAAVAGLLAGFVLGLLGAGGTVVGIPFFLYLAVVSPHTALGSNALGVFMIATALVAYRLWRREVLVAPGVVFALPGVAGIFIGARIGLEYPGGGLVFLLGFLLFIIAGWLFFLSTKVAKSSTLPAELPRHSLARGRLLRIIPVAFAVGGAAGFFGIGGGFMIVPSLALAAGIDLVQSISTSLIPIAAFAGLVGFSYLGAGDVNIWLSVVMVPAGVVGGFLGMKLGNRIDKTTTYRVFGAFLALLGVYIVARG